jgi:hypothetical protein
MVEENGNHIPLGIEDRYHRVVVELYSPKSSSNPMPKRYVKMLK